MTGISGISKFCEVSGRLTSAWALIMLVCVTWAESAVGAVCPSWVVQVSGTSESLRAVHFPVNTVTGYAGGGAGTILKTTDGAKNIDLSGGALAAMVSGSFQADVTVPMDTGMNPYRPARIRVQTFVAPEARLLCKQSPRQMR